MFFLEKKMYYNFIYLLVYNSKTVVTVINFAFWKFEVCILQYFNVASKKYRCKTFQVKKNEKTVVRSIKYKDEWSHEQLLYLRIYIL